MDTYRLRYFCTIAETGSLTKASEILGISHSGLSKAISVLEGETNLKLFQPQGRGLEITEQGKWFYSKAQEILKIETEISSGMKLQTKTLRLGLSEVLALTCAAAIAGEFEASMTILETDVGEAEFKILAGELDFGLTFAPQPRVELEYLEITDVKFNAFCRQALIDRVESPQHVPFVIPASHLPMNPMGYKVRDGWPSDIERKTSIYVSGFAIAMELVRAGECAVYMPNFVSKAENLKAKDESKLHRIPEFKKAESRRKIYLVKLKNSPETKEMKKVAKIIRQICTD